MIEIPTNLTYRKAFTAWIWYKENDIEASGTDGAITGGTYIFKFKSEEDAVAFKLRWS